MPIQNTKTVDILQGLEEQMGDTVGVLQGGQPQKADGQPITDPAELEAYYQKLSQMGIDVKNLGDAIQDTGEAKKEINQQVENAIPPGTLGVSGSSYFSLKTSQDLSQLQSPANAPMARNEIIDPGSSQGGGSRGGMGENDPFQSFSIENVNFPDPKSVKDALIAIGNPDDATSQFFDRFGKKNGLTQDPNVPERVSSDDDAIRDPINEFFSTDDDVVRDKIAMFIYESIVSEGAKPSEKENTVPDTSTQQTIAQLVNETNKLVKKLAETHNSEEHKGFNLKKEAQHKSLENVMMYGPENKIDAFTGQPISDWHLVERNKGFGLKFDGIWNIDWEAIWRGTVMDKYSAPYKDKDGNWVGGYIEDRFEVDKNIPSYNNMQLKPGEKRRPTPPEFNSTEARLEAAREGGEPFNWAKEASSKKKVSIGYSTPNQIQNIIADSLTTKTAADGGSGSKNDNALPELPSLDSPTLKQPQRFCTLCGAKMKNMIGGKGKGNPNECPSCHAIVPTPLTADPQIGPDPAGKQAPVINPYIQQGVNLQASGGIFFNGSNFVCYAQNKKVLFNTFNEAEQFQQKNTPKPVKTKRPLNVDVEECEKPVGTGGGGTVLTPEQIEKQKAMNGLAIDG